MKYHLNAKGDAKLCRASKKPCPYIETSPHFSTEDQAREHYEAIQSGKAPQTNQLTLESYNQKVNEYIQGSPQDVGEGMRSWMDRSFSTLPRGSRIVELGAAFGRDSVYLRDQGFDVIATDAVDGFVDKLKDLDLKTEKVNILEDTIPYADGVLANAVFLHFTKEEAELGFSKVARAIPDNGVFALTLKEGEGEEVSDEKIGSSRYFKYWTADEVTKSLKDSGFDRVEVVRDEGNVVWLNITAVKTPQVVGYRGGHQPQETGVPGHDVENHFPDFYSHPEYYRTGDTKSDAESIRAMQRMRGNPEAEVTIYRALPDASYPIENGNWVSLSKSYAEGHGIQSDDPSEDWPVISMKVKAKDIRSPGDSINEWGYFPVAD